MIFCILLTLSFSCGQDITAPDAPNAIQALSDNETDGFAKAINPRVFKFPDDFGPHPEFQTEWWYYTGNLSDKSGREFGYQLTFFRRALSPNQLDRESSWSTNQIYFAHFALTDVARGKFYSSERWSRAAAGLSGAQANPYRVWLDNWSVEASDDSYILKAQEGNISINLVMKPLKPEVLQGNEGLSQKSGAPGNASYYFSQTRIESEGKVLIGDKRFSVSGLSWLDREWSTSALSQDQEGWDWFSIQLDDGREIMLYQLRLKDGSVDPFSSGSLVGINGTVVNLKKDDFEIEVVDTRKSTETETVYPSEWQISIPKYSININVIPLINNQEILLSFIYWEGAVKVTGDNLSGKGYVELTGYKTEN